jgi:hypothetical protein
MKGSNSHKSNSGNDDKNSMNYDQDESQRVAINTEAEYIRLRETKHL